MNISSSLGTRSFGNRLLAMASAVRPAVRFLLWVILAFVGLLILFVLFPPEGVRPGQPRAWQVAGVQAFAVVATLFVSGFAPRLFLGSHKNHTISWIALISRPHAVYLFSSLLSYTS